VEGKKTFTKFILLFVYATLFTLNDWYDKLNIFTLILLSIILGVVTHYVVELVFDKIEKHQNN